MHPRSIPALVLLAALATTATQAEARGRLGHSEFLEFVAPIPLPDPDGKGALSLCALKTKNHVFGIPIYYSADGYAMAAGKCDAGQYYPITAEKLAAGKQAGIFPADLPDEPQLSTAQKMNGYIAFGAIGFLLLMLLRARLGQGRAAKQRKAALGALPPVAQRIADVTCAMAKADGAVSPHEVATIASIVTRLTGENCDPRLIAEIAEMSRSDLQPADFRALGKGLKTEAKELVLRAAMLVAMADGKFEKAEIAFISQLSKAFKISPERRTALLHGSAVPA
ncbi:MAG: TerB family tellurite resistance protein [Thioclava sp.]|nr:TerB family tellurite resistance protein [Thioclava sp.]MBD3802950.1 TerB family tellurite resistance protein [Thioclava sp.]